MVIEIYRHVGNSMPHKSLVKVNKGEGAVTVVIVVGRLSMTY